MSTRKTNAKAAAKASKAAKPAVNNDAITTVVGAKGTSDVIVSTANSSLIVRKWQDNAKFRNMAARGKSMAALKAYVATIAKPVAKLANGIAAKDAPHSAKAVSDQKAAPAAKPAKSAGKAKDRTAKASKAKQPSRGVDRAYSVGKKEDTSKAGTWRNYMLTTIRAHKNTADAKAAHAKSKSFSSNKLDFNWANSQGYIVYSK